MSVVWFIILLFRIIHLVTFRVYHDNEKVCIKPTALEEWVVALGSCWLLLVWMLVSRVGNRSGRTRFAPLDRLDRLKVGPRIDPDPPDRLGVGKYSKVNRSDRFENEMDPT
jgi:hypothetical protein